MEVIDLREHSGEIEILLPKEWKWNTQKGNYVDAMILELPEKDPLDLVPKSWEEYCERHSIELDAAYHRLTGICPLEDINAFIALMMLRRLWHEWIKVLGAPTIKGKAVCIVQENYGNGLAICDSTVGALCFADRSHAKKFIECFGVLLEKAKILL